MHASRPRLFVPIALSAGTDRRPLSWREDVPRGVEPVDREHRELLNAARRIRALLEAGAGFRVVSAALVALLTDAESHFRAEERLFAALPYDGADAHRANHRLLGASLEQCIADAPALPSARLADEVGNALVALADHILVHDRQYRRLAVERRGRVARATT